MNIASGTAAAPMKARNSFLRMFNDQLTPRGPPFSPSRIHADELAVEPGVGRLRRGLALRLGDVGEIARKVICGGAESDERRNRDCRSQYQLGTLAHPRPLCN